MRPAIIAIARLTIPRARAIIHVRVSAALVAGMAAASGRAVLPATALGATGKEDEDHADEEQDHGHERRPHPHVVVGGRAAAVAVDFVFDDL